jgi:NAD-dependent dihydropyrimidine dehydrogenase PreA subunit
MEPLFTMVTAARSEENEMAFVITKPCIGVKDTACVVVCPVDVIHPTKDESDFDTAEQLYINQTDCIDCGLCVDECPVKAIFQDRDAPSEFEEFIEKNVAYYRR